MAISYPVTAPTSDIGLANIEITPVNAIALSQSPFTYAQQVIAFSGERWGLNVTIPPVLRNKAEPWVAFLLSLRGSYGTFLLGDPMCASPQGTASSASITGSAGARSVSVSMSGTLKAGDYIQIGSGSSTRLHKVLQDKSGSGTLEIWPALRSAHSGSVTLSNTKGLWRLSSNQNPWSISNDQSYSIQFEAIEAI